MNLNWDLDTIGLPSPYNYQKILIRLRSDRYDEPNSVQMCFTKTSVIVHETLFSVSLMETLLDFDYHIFSKYFIFIFCLVYSVWSFKK